MSFNTLGLAPELLRAVTALGYTTPSPIQQQAIPWSWPPHLPRPPPAPARPQFVLPILQRPMIDGHRAGNSERHAPDPHPHPRTGAGAPELAITTPPAAAPAPPSRGVGSSRRPGPRRGWIIVATPGRLQNMQQKTVDLSISSAGVDEGDRMLTWAFCSDAPDRAALPRQARRPAVLGNASTPSGTGRLMGRPGKQRNSIATTVSHRVHPVEVSRKELLLELLSRDGAARRWCSAAASTFGQAGQVPEQHGLRAR